jgi:diguanylate cyclase (GGDEF)-like protein
LLPETPIWKPGDLDVDTSTLALEDLPAKSVAERLRKTIEQTSIETETGATVAVTISLGIAESDDCTDIERLIDHADQALLGAKRSGRNQVVIWNPKQ